MTHLDEYLLEGGRIISINEVIRMGMKIKPISVMPLICFMVVLVIQTGLAAAPTIWVYPVGTPVTTHDPAYHYSELTVEVSPKYMTVKTGEVLKWIVNLEIKVLQAGKIDHIEMWIWLKTTKGRTEPDWFSNLLNETSTEHGNDGWYIFSVESPSGSPFTEGETVTIEFWVKSPDTLTSDGNYELVKARHYTEGPDWSGQESTGDCDIQVIFDVGPDFVIPEFPLGTISAVFISLITLGIVSRAKRNT